VVFVILNVEFWVLKYVFVLPNVFLNRKMFIMWKTKNLAQDILCKVLGEEFFGSGM